MAWLSVGSAVFSEADEEVRGATRITPLRHPLPEKAVGAAPEPCWTLACFMSRFPRLCSCSRVLPSSSCSQRPTSQWLAGFGKALRRSTCALISSNSDVRYLWTHYPDPETKPYQYSMTLAPRLPPPHCSQKVCIAVPPPCEFPLVLLHLCLSLSSIQNAFWCCFVFLKKKLRIRAAALSLFF